MVGGYTLGIGLGKKGGKGMGISVGDTGGTGCGEAEKLESGTEEGMPG